MTKRVGMLGVALLATLAHAGLITQSGPRLFVEAGGGSSVTADLQASRTSCSTPCAVFFDATGTTHTDGGVDTWKDIGYYFDYDDAGAGNWTHTGNSKTFDAGGPLAAHVFDSAGTYTVKVRAYDPALAEWSDDSVTVTVTAADTTYSSTNTVCLSRNTDHTGCPSGATQSSSVSAWPTFVNSRRYLLHRGQDFTSLGQLNFSQSGGNGLQDAQLGAYGSGAKPLVGDVQLGSDSPRGIANWTTRVVVMDLDATEINSLVGEFDLLVYRNDLNRGSGTGRGNIHTAVNFHWYASGGNGGESNGLTWANPDKVFLVDNDVDAQGGDAMTGNGHRFALLGNRSNDTEQHNMRLWQAYKGLAANNFLPGRIGGGSDNGRHLLKFHSAGMVDTRTGTWTVPAASDAEKTAMAQWSRNIFGESGVGNSQFTTSIGPQNSESNEWVDKAIIEENTFVELSAHIADFTRYGSNISTRGNVMSGGGTFNQQVLHSMPNGLHNGPYYHSATQIATDAPD